MSLPPMGVTIYGRPQGSPNPHATASLQLVVHHPNGVRGTHNVNLWDAGDEIAHRLTTSGDQTDRGALADWVDENSEHFMMIPSEYKPYLGQLIRRGHRWPPEPPVQMSRLDVKRRYGRAPSDVVASMTKKQGEHGGGHDPNNHSDMVLADFLDDHDDPLGTLVRRDMEYRNGPDSGFDTRLRKHLKTIAGVDSRDVGGGTTRYNLASGSGQLLVNTYHKGRNTDGDPIGHRVLWNAPSGVYAAAMTPAELAHLLQEHGGKPNTYARRRRYGRVPADELQGHFEGGEAGGSYNPQNVADGVFADKLADADDPRELHVRRDLSYRGPGTALSNNVDEAHKALAGQEVFREHPHTENHDLGDGTILAVAPVGENPHQPTSYEHEWYGNFSNQYGLHSHHAFVAVLSPDEHADVMKRLGIGGTEPEPEEEYDPPGTPTGGPNSPGGEYYSRRLKPDAPSPRASVLTDPKAVVRYGKRCVAAVTGLKVSLEKTRYQRRVVVRYAQHPPSTRMDQLKALTAIHDPKNTGYTGNVNDWLHPEYQVTNGTRGATPHMSRYWELTHTPTGLRFRVGKLAAQNRFTVTHLPEGGEPVKPPYEWDTPEEAMGVVHRMVGFVTGGKHGTSAQAAEQDYRPDEMIPEDHYGMSRRRESVRRMMRVGDPATHDGMIRQINETRDPSGLGPFADFLEEQGAPGAALARRAWENSRDPENVNPPFSPHMWWEGDNGPQLWTGEGGEDTQTTLSEPGNTEIRSSWNGTTSRGRLHVVHPPQSGFPNAPSVLSYTVPVESIEDLHHLTSDLPEPMRNRIVEHLTPHLRSGTTRMSRRGSVRRYAFDERAQFEKAIDANPEDPLTHGVYADWLDDNGHHDEAKFRRAMGEWINRGVHEHIRFRPAGPHPNGYGELPDRPESWLVEEGQEGPGGFRVSPATLPPYVRPRLASVEEERQHLANPNRGWDWYYGNHSWPTYRSMERDLRHGYENHVNPPAPTRPTPEADPNVPMGKPDRMSRLLQIRYAAEFNMGHLLEPRAGGRTNAETVNDMGGGITHHNDGVWSHRFVLHENGQPVSALHVDSADGKTGRVIGVHTAPEHRRKGHARTLLTAARRVFPGLTFDDMRSDDGTAWVDSVTKASRRRYASMSRPEDVHPNQPDHYDPFPPPHDDSDRRLWVLNHEPLYRLWQSTLGPEVDRDQADPGDDDFIDRHRDEIDEEIRRQPGMDDYPNRMSRRRYAAYRAPAGGMIRYGMASRESFRNSIGDNPLDGDNRLVYADYLDENNEPDEARFQRSLGTWMKSHQFKNLPRPHRGVSATPEVGPGFLLTAGGFYLHPDTVLPEGVRREDIVTGEDSDHFPGYKRVGGYDQAEAQMRESFNMTPPKRVTTPDEINHNDTKLSRRRYAAYRAPAGGMIVRGTGYKGGEMVPDMEGAFANPPQPKTGTMPDLPVRKEEGASTPSIGDAPYQVNSGTNAGKVRRIDVMRRIAARRRSIGKRKLPT